MGQVGDKRTLHIEEALSLGNLYYEAMREETEKTDQDYDVIVIGSGPAGYEAASSSAKLGKSVALIERNIDAEKSVDKSIDPTKFLLNAAEKFHRFKNVSTTAKLDDCLIAPSDTSPDKGEAKEAWAAAQEALRGTIHTKQGKTLNEIGRHFRRLGIDLYQGNAAFKTKKELSLLGQAKNKPVQNIFGEKIIIATGATATLPKADGLIEAGYLTTRDAPYLKELPNSLLIIGAGADGVELAQVFQRFGVDVILVESANQILPSGNPNLTNQLAAVLNFEGVNIRLQSEVIHVAKAADCKKRVTIRYRSGYENQVVVDEIILATPAEPDVADLNLSAANVCLSDCGSIQIDPYGQTSTPGIWAVGNVTGTEVFNPFASSHSAQIAENIFVEPNIKLENLAQLHVTFTDPPLAQVGTIRKDLVQKETKFSLKSVGLYQPDRFRQNNRSAGFINLYFADNETIVGGEAFGAGATEIISMLSLAIKIGATMNDLSRLDLPFYTCSEGVRFAT